MNVLITKELSMDLREDGIQEVSLNVNRISSMELQMEYVENGFQMEK
jgi:hypothetical protein